MDNYANTSGTYGAHYHIHAQTWLNWQDANSNTSSIHLRVYLAVDNGYSWSGLGYFNAQGRINGSQVAAGGFPGSGAGPGTWIAIDYDTTVGHDVNGNWSGSAGASTQASWSGIGSGGGDWGFALPRLALAPPIAGNVADTITPVSARLGAEISGYGHGTSAALEMFYRLQGSGTWISLGQQGDVAGYNYWNVTGLKPGKTYEYTFNVWNNNGDTASSATYTFKTKPISGMISVLQAIV